MVYHPPGNVEQILTDGRCPCLMPLFGKDEAFKNQGHIVGQNTMPEVGIVAVESSCRHVGDEVVVVQFPDSQFDLRSLVVILPDLLRRHVRLIVADDLIMPFGKQHPLNILLPVNETSHCGKFTGFCPCAHPVGKGSTLDAATGIKGFEGIVRHALLYPVQDVPVLH